MALLLAPQYCVSSFSDVCLFEEGGSAISLIRVMIVGRGTNMKWRPAIEVVDCILHRPVIE